MTTTYAQMAETLAGDAIEILSNERETYEAIVAILMPKVRSVYGDDPARTGELVRELTVRMYRAGGLDPERERVAVESLTSRFLSLVNWNVVGEYFLNAERESNTPRQIA